ncbi:hypothetical protein SteCoe_28964 [Stentor coeruleus]|uniref:RING-type domain-containing protein n=1 Tax=Stentor coeruleus TaxID=5963 RepID=A0A1R2B6Z9_9CILI|nr:hypothetical protein SteCoe_28964 [Stentor coeruleus]
MAELYLQNVGFLEVEIRFPTYYFKFNSFQGICQPKTITQLFFQRFMYLNEYIPLRYYNFSDKYCAQIEIPDPLIQNDLQKIFFNNLYSQTSNLDCIVAEAVDESAEFIYLIIDQNRIPTINRMFSQCTLEVYKFAYQELWSLTSNAYAYIRNLQLENSFLENQLTDYSTCIECIKQNTYSLQIQAQNKDIQLEKLMEEKKKKSVPKKPLNKINVKIELPSMDCLLCCSNPKSIVFLPCGHCVACKACTTEKLEMVLGKVINQRRTPRICPVCKQAVKEAKEVFI